MKFVCIPRSLLITLSIIWNRYCSRNFTIFNLFTVILINSFSLWQIIFSVTCFRLSNNYWNFCFLCRTIFIFDSHSNISMSFSKAICGNSIIYRNSIVTFIRIQAINGNCFLNIVCCNFTFSISFLNWRHCWIIIIGLLIAYCYRNLNNSN